MDTFSDFPGTSFSLLTSEAYEHTSTLQYVNTQLVSHGFARPPGLYLIGLADDESEKLVKCLLGMLGQRLDDIRTTEELGTKLRTLTYEHERLQSMYRTAVDASANAEREMHQFKSKLATSQKLLAAETTAHKQVLAEFQRTRTSLQYLRSTTQNELRRKDKEVERVMERWNKVADVQAKLLATQSGMRCANYMVGTAGSPVRGPGLMELALEQAEEARGELVKENDAFRTVLLGTAKSFQGVIHTVKEFTSDTQVEEPVPLTHPALFAPPTSMLSQPENAHAKLRELFAAFHEAISNIPNQAPPPSSSNPEAEDKINNLNDVITSLRAELEQARQSSSALAAHSQALLDRFTTHASERVVSGWKPTSDEAAEISLELMDVPEQDELQLKLESRAADLQKERERFTEAAVKLGKEKAALEAGRMTLIEEKRRWAVEQMLAELPPTPCPDLDLVSPPRPAKIKRQHCSPSPPRIRPRKANGNGSSLGSPSKTMALLKRVQAIAAAEDLEPRDSGKRRLRERRQGGVRDTQEVICDPGQRTQDQPLDNNVGLRRSTIPKDPVPLTVPGTVAEEMKTSLPLVLPTTFTLPPPSPKSSFTLLDLPSVPSQSSSLPQLPSSAVPKFDSIPLAAASAPLVTTNLRKSRGFPSPRTPRATFNPLLKHAYSPARPSPLSRILMLADSPPLPPSVSSIQDEPEDVEQSDPSPIEPKASLERPPPRELDHPIDQPSPLRERSGGDLNGNASEHTEAQEEDEKRSTAKEKGKGRAISGQTVAQKENVVASRSKASDVPSGVSVSRSILKTKASKTTGPATKKMVGVRFTTKTLAARSSVVASGSGAGPSAVVPQAGRITTAPSKPGGARRVPIAQAEKLGVRRT